MSAPYVGKRVVIDGTSRADLNGSIGSALDYDRDKGRYTVRLDNGQTVALKPANLQDAPAGQAHSTPRGASSTSSSGPFQAGQVNWTTIALVGMAAVWLYQWFAQSGAAGGSGGLWGTDGEEAEYDDRDEGYLKGNVREVATLDQLRGALAQHSENTGLPVVVDFFSHSCGPCRMIAPAFKKTAAEFKGRAAFLKVDVNRNYEASEACRVRSMPTFQFYLNKKKVFEFSGADERGLQRYTTKIADQAEEAGTYVGQYVPGEALQAFYEVHDPSKANESLKLAEKYSRKTAQLMRVCKQKYGKVPTVSARKGEGKAKQGGRAADVKAAVRSAGDMPAEELQAELQKLKQEMQRRGLEEEKEEEEMQYVPAEGLTKEIHKVLVIGSGPAALAAAIYAARAGLRPLVLAPAFGGQLLGKGVDVENYPGVVGEYATGRKLVELMRRQALSFETRFVDTMVLEVDFKQRPFHIRVNATDGRLLARAIILATGAESRWLGAEGEHAFRGRGVSACATCDGFLFRGKDVVVVGGGDHAMEDALHLARTSRSVTVIHRRDRFRASRILADRVLNHTSIKVFWNTTVQSFHGGEDLTHVSILHSSDGKSQPRSEKLAASGAFVAVGHDPQTGFLGKQLELDEAGYVLLRQGTATSVAGVFAAGDVADRTYRQAITASGTGAAAALDAERFLGSEGG